MITYRAEVFFYLSVHLKNLTYLELKHLLKKKII